MSVLALNDFYRHALESFGYTVRSGRVTYITSSGEEDVMIGDKLLVLPDDRFLKSPNLETEIPFHPLCENPHRGESEVVKMVLETVVANLNIALLGVLLRLYEDVVCIEDTKKLSTEQSEVLTYVSNAGKNTRKAILGMVKHIKNKGDHDPLISCNLRRRCPLNGQQYERVCVVRFPFAEMERKDEPYGLKTVAEVDTLRGLLDFVVPGWQADDTWSVGTNTFVAPYFTSILLMYGKIGTRLNEVIDLYKDFSKSLELYRITGIEYVMEKLETEGYMKSLSESIPALGDSNRGSVDVTRKPETSYAVEQPKQAVDVPWNTATQAQQRPAAPTVAEGTTTYVPSTPATNGGVAELLAQALQQTLAGAAGSLLPGLTPQAQPVIDTNTFHGRQLAKQALLTPLTSQQALLNNGFGTSPFLETNANNNGGGATYVPGQVTGNRATAQSQSLHRHQPINHNPLGF